MTSQYDSIGSKYSVFKELITSVIEEANIKQAIAPYLHGPNVRALDLASGTGYYTKKLVDWGASSVLGIDLSKAMVETAEAQLAEDHKYKDRIKFQVGNALDLGGIAGEEPFDIILGAWLLNYASSAEEMTQMFRTIVANLKDGGSFIGLTPRATENVDARAFRLTEGRTSVPVDYPVQVDYYERLESGEGWKTEISTTAPGDKVVFRNFHLKKSLYEESARLAGLKGLLQWQKIEIPEHARVVLARQGWETYVGQEDQFGILIVEK